MLKIKFFIFSLVIFSFFIVLGCSYTARSQKSSKDSQESKNNIFSYTTGNEIKGFYHIVKEGETLSQISRRYNVSVETIAKLNHFPDRDNIVKGQLIFIPSSIDFLKFKEKSFSYKDFGFIWPVKGKVISFFSNSEDNFKPYIDIEKISKSKIVAVDKGIISFCSRENLGNIDKKIVMIEHKKGFTSIYIYEGNILVEVGDRVYQGQPIFEDIKEAGSNILRFEIRQNHISKDPVLFFPEKNTVN